MRCLGKNHATHINAHPSARVVAVADLRKESAEALAAELEISAVYDNAEGLLADGNVDAITIAMPAVSRKVIALKAFVAHKHVLTEKPAALNAGKVREMIAAKSNLIAGRCRSRFRHLFMGQPPSGKPYTSTKNGFNFCRRLNIEYMVCRKETRGASFVQCRISVSSC